ncbi:MAG: hypothetical protein HYY25_11350 [Candidatus Wallbacteria bacterium]|nr:hypothetical protein [Candidatus Wallbacteria bacterium]
MSSLDEGSGGRIPVAVAVLLACYGGVFLAVPGETFYTTDAGANYLLSRRVAERGLGLDVELPFTKLAGSAVPLEMAAVRTLRSPPPHMFLRRYGEGWTLTYPPLFPAVSGWLLALFGVAGLRLLPAAAAALAAWVASGLVAAGEGRAEALLLFGVATPLLFYAHVYWGHSLGALLVLGALALWARGRPLTAGFCCAMAVTVRTECLPAVALVPAAAALAAGMVRPMARAAARYAMGAALVLLPLALFQWSVYGTPAGAHVASIDPATNTVTAEAAAEGGPKVARNLVHYLFRNYRMLDGMAAVLAAAGMCGWAAAAAAPGATRAVLVTVAAGGGLVSMLFAVLVPGQYAPGLMLVMPLAALAPLGLRESLRSGHPTARFLAAFALLDLLIVAALAPRGGWQWGPRYLLPVVPLVAWLGWQARSAAPRATLVLAVASLVLQATSVRDLRLQLNAQQELVTAVAGSDPLVTDVWFLSWQLMPALWGRDFLHADTPAQLGTVLSAASQRGLGAVRHISGSWKHGEPGGAWEAELARLGWRVSTARELRFPSGDRLALRRLERPGR